MATITDVRGQQVKVAKGTKRFDVVEVSLRKTILRLSPSNTRRLAYSLLLVAEDIVAEPDIRMPEAQ